MGLSAHFYDSKERASPLLSGHERLVLPASSGQAKTANATKSGNVQELIGN